MMVVATTVALEVVYAYCFDNAVPKRTKGYVLLIATIVVLCAGWRAYIAIADEIAGSEEVSGGALLAQAIIWTAAFVVAFCAKVIALRARVKTGSNLQSYEQAE